MQTGRTVIVEDPGRHPDGAGAVAARLARGLTERGLDVRILRTDPVAGPGAATVAGPDAARDRLPAGPGDTWGQRWEALERYLEERAPCVYVMWPESLVNRVVSRLSGRVRLVGVVRSERSLVDGDVERFAPHWHAVVAVGRPLHFGLVSRFPQLACRTVGLRQPTSDEPAESDAAVEEYLERVARDDDRARRPAFVRARGNPVGLLRADVDGPVSPHVGPADFEELCRAVPWPDPPRVKERRPGAAPRAPRLEDHKVIVAATAGAIGGVDVFATHLVRGLRDRGIDARLHGRRPADGDTSAAFPPDLPFDARPVEIDTEALGWPNRWRSMVAHLGRLAPCIYLPNCDSDFSCVAPLLADGVRVIGIGHGDDPWHYEHLCRIGHACDAIVGVSRAVSDHLRALAPSFAPRIETIPYGVPTPGGRSPDVVPADRGGGPGPLRIVSTGRLVGRQERAFDVVAIARELAARAIPFELTVVGDGNFRGAMERAADLVSDRRVRFTGARPNADVAGLLAASDASLVPSAYEGPSIDMLEAMSHGVVPVVSDIRSGVPDVIVPGENGLVAPVGDVVAFADRLEWLWKHPSERVRMAAAAVRTVTAGYGVDRMVDRYVELFRRIVAAPCRRPGGPLVPPEHLRRELSWTLWASRVACDPAASGRRVIRRFTGRGR